MILQTIILWYGILALSHLFIQINLGHIEFLKYFSMITDKSFTPSVGIIIPMYN